MFSPQGLQAEELKYQNIYQSGYVIGYLDLNDVSLTNYSEFKEIDMGFDFYAPQVFNYNGRNTMIGWVGMPDRDDEYISSKDGWMFGLTMPRVLEYKDGILYQKPLELIENMRHEKIIHIKDSIENNYITKLDSKGIECKLDLDLSDIEDLEIRFKFKDEYISLLYNKKDEICTLDRDNMELGGKGIRKFKLKAKDSMKLHMFIDNSIMEIYYQDGLEATTLMYFPKEDGLEIEIKNNIKINEFQVWNLRGMKYEK